MTTTEGAGVDRVEPSSSHDSDAWVLPTSEHAADRYAALLDIAFDLSCLVDSSGSVHYASPSVLRILGRCAQDASSFDIFTCLHPDDAEGFRQLLDAVVRGTEPVRTRGRVRTADGSYRLIEALAVNLLDDPQVGGIALAGRDLTGEQEARRQARSAQEQLAVMLDNSPVIVFSLDREGTITSARGRELTDIGIDPGSLVGVSIYSFADDDRSVVTADAVTRCLAGEDVDIVYELGGKLFDLRYRPVREPGEIVGVLGVGTDISASVRAMEQVRASEARWRSLVASSVDAALVCDGDPDATITFLSPASVSIFGWEPEDVLGRSAFEFVHDDDVPDARRAFLRVAGDPEWRETVEFRIRHRDGSYRWAESAVRNLLDDPAVRGVVGNLRDITERRESRQALEASEARYRLIVESTREGIALVDSERTILYANERLATVTGLPLERLVGSKVDQWLDERAMPFVEEGRKRRAVQGGGSSYEIPFRRPDGEDCHLMITVTPLPPDAPYEGTLVLASDVTQRKRAEAELERLALHDALTGLPNRALLLDRIAGSLTRRRRHGGVVALLLVDVDQFTSVNDSLGNRGGDELLRTFTERLERMVRAGDTVGRLGGDEFAVLTEELESESEAALLAERLLAALSEPVLLVGAEGPVEAVVTASVGVAVTASDTIRPEDLLARGELAMHRAKNRGRACHEVLSDNGGPQAVDRLRVVNELRSGLRRGELVLHYQPLVELASGRVVGAEALARWNHPERGLLGPDDFIALAEESGLIRELGAWVLRTACGQVVRAAAAGFVPGDSAPIIAVNLSAQQLADPGLASLVAGVLSDTGLPAHRLMLEVTETALLSDTSAAIDELEALRRLGVQLALDDFGTGFSSLTYLKRFPLHELKIDRSFVSELGTDPASGAIVASVIQLARAIGLSVVAEGVETEGQRRALLDLGCTLGQGFLFGHPVPAEDFPAPSWATNAVTSW